MNFCGGAVGGHFAMGNRDLGRVGSERVKDGHTDGDAIFDLLVDEAEVVVHASVSDFDASIDRAWVHEPGLAITENLEAGVGETEEAMILANGGKQGVSLAFHLDAEEVDRMRVPVEGVGPVVETGDFGRRIAGHESAGSKVGDLHAETAQKKRGGAGDARVLDITDNEDAFAREFVVGDFTKGEGVKKGLSGVGVPAVAGVNNGGSGILGDEVGDAGLLVADDDVVETHGFEGVDGIDNRLAFDDRGRIDIEAGDVSRKAGGGDFERGESAGGGLVKEREHGATFECRHLFDGAFEEVFEGSGV